MPAGTDYLYKEGMLSSEMEMIISPDKKRKYCGIKVKNHFLHAVHPLAWIKKLELEIDGKEICNDDVKFVLRGQWFNVADMVTITDVYWNLAEEAKICIPVLEKPEPGQHHVKLTFSMSMLEDTQIMDTRGLWPLRVEFVEDDLKLEVAE